MICDSLPSNAFKGNIHTVHNSSSLKNDHNNCNPHHNETVRTYDSSWENEDVFQVLNTIRCNNIDNIVSELFKCKFFLQQTR